MNDDIASALADSGFFVRGNRAIGEPQAFEILGEDHDAHVAAYEGYCSEKWDYDPISHDYNYDDDF